MTKNDKKTNSHLGAIIERYGSLCHDCGMAFFGHHYKEGDLDGITIHEGRCGCCGRQKMGMVPMSDWTQMIHRNPILWD